MRAEASLSILPVRSRSHGQKKGEDARLNSYRTSLNFLGALAEPRGKEGGRCDNDVLGKVSKINPKILRLYWGFEDHIASVDSPR